MNFRDLTSDRRSLLWIVVESDHRWSMAVRRFAAEMLPPPWESQIVPVDPVPSAADASELVRYGPFEHQGSVHPAIVLWDYQRDRLAAVCDAMASVSVAAPRALQLVAGPGMSHADKILVSELGCSAWIGHPEELPRLRHLVRAHVRNTAGLRKTSTANRAAGTFTERSVL